MKKNEKKIRLSQVISNFGVGAVYDILGESLVMKDVTKWKEPRYRGKGRLIKAERLLSYLRATGMSVWQLHEPARTGQKGSTSGTLPYERFPRWLFCSKCRRMHKWSFAEEHEGKAPTCKYCPNHPRLTPMRFIMICDHGHMSDINWGIWAHSGHNPAGHNCESENLEFRTGQTRTGGLESVAVKCRECEAFRSLEGLLLPHAMPTAGIYCSGKQPWEFKASRTFCQRTAHAVQRGAGNVYYPIIRSALTIPPESGNSPAVAAPDATPDLRDQVTKHAFYELLQTNVNNTAVFQVIAIKLAEQLNCTVNDIEQVLNGGTEAASHATGDGIPDIEGEEWFALTVENPEQDDRDKFVTKHCPVYPPNTAGMLNSLITKVVSVIKLREVRALTGFYRYHPGGAEDGPDKAKATPPDLGQGENWLPAVEVYGEGVFISVNEDKLKDWEAFPAVAARVRVLKERAAASTYESLLPEATPRFVMLHTLAHILIRRLAFECGYSSASLRERIYASAVAGRAGILIYTAAGDSEGTLGGLSRQAEPGRLATILLAALQDAQSCSADPICLESQGQGLDAMNLAACHACALVAETSCTSMNLLLDRALVTGDGVVPGFFEQALNEMILKTSHLT